MQKIKRIVFPNDAIYVLAGDDFIYRYKDKQWIKVRLPKGLTFNPKKVVITIYFELCQGIKAFLLHNGLSSSTDIINKLKKDGFSYYMVNRHLKYLTKEKEIQLISGGGLGNRRFYKLIEDL